MKVFNGKKEAEKILSDLKKKISKEKIEPKLAVILVGEDNPSKLYVKLKTKAAEKIGIKLTVYRFKEGEGEGKIIQKIKNLNNNSLISGIIVQLPLPAKTNPNKIIITLYNLNVILGREDFKEKIEVLNSLLRQLGPELKEVSYIDLRFKDPVIKKK